MTSHDIKCCQDNCQENNPVLATVKLPEGKEYPGDKFYGMVCTTCSNEIQNENQ